PFLAPNWFPERSWKICHRIGYYVLLLWVIATFNGLVINYFQDLAFSWRNYGKIIGQTTALGILPITMIVLYRYNLKLRANLETAAKLTSVVTPSVPTEGLPTQSFTGVVAAEAYGNYVKVYRARLDEVSLKTERITLSKFVAEQDADDLIRCHRSFAVNPHWVSEVSGNAQGLRLTLREGGIEIPVSRTYIPVIKEALQA
ncbi:MAG: LytTR family DNA-binding domain-containing protein, partial [Bacteroidota bacterium]